MSHATTILTTIGSEPGLTDRQISDCTGIAPVQQVNAVCRQLAAAGATLRVKGPQGAVVNIPISTSLPTSPPDQEISRPIPMTIPCLVVQSGVPEQIESLDPARTLMVIPCSKSKHPGTLPTSTGSLTDTLPHALAAELTNARTLVASRARLNTSTLCPAWLRYDGTFYRVAHGALQEAVRRQAHLVIMSGAYGLIEASDAIGDYEAPMNKRDWPNGLLNRCLAAHARSRGLTAIVAFLAETTQYAKVVRHGSWVGTGMSHVFLISPHSSDGHPGQKKITRASGEAFAAFWQRRLTPDWLSTNGLTLHVERLS